MPSARQEKLKEISTFQDRINSAYSKITSIESDRVSINVQGRDHLIQINILKQEISDCLIQITALTTQL